jgi:hypothetical protein
MAVYGGPEVVTDGLVLCLDAGNARSFRGRAATNLVVSPKSVTTGYATTVPTRLNNQLVNFDGTYTAGMLVGTGDQYFAYTGASTTNGNRYTASWYMKAGSLTTVFLSWGGAHNGNRTNFTFNLVSGQITISTLASGETYGADNLGNGWWRVWYTSTLSSGNYYFPQINIGSGSVYIGGLQIETGSSPSSFVEGNRGTTVATGGGWADLSGRGNHAELINGVGESRGNGGAIVFDGSNDKGTFSSPISANSPQTYEIWAKAISSPTATNGFSYLLHNHVSSSLIGSSYMAIGYGGIIGVSGIEQNEIYACFSGAWTTMKTSVIANTITPNQILLTWDGTSQKAYVDGKFRVSAQLLTVSQNFSTITAFGDSINTYRPIVGNIYLIKIYNRSLSAAEVAQNYAATRGRFGL